MIESRLRLTRPLVVLDTETTGTYPAKDRIVEVACIKIHPDGRRETFHRLVNPTVPIPAECSRIHGITDDRVAQEPPFSAIARELSDFLADCDLCGYNIEGFDLPILYFELARAGIELDFAARCVVDAQVIFFKEEGRTLSDALRFYAGEEHAGAHGALADAEATARVLAGQLDRYAHLPRNVADLAVHYAASGTRPLDPERKAILRDNVPFVNFGQNRGKSFDQVFGEEPGFFDWILRADFSAPLKKFVEKYIAEKRKGAGSPPRGQQKIDF